jgi:Arylsulfotransferase (ASST)
MHRLSALSSRVILDPFRAVLASAMLTACALAAFVAIAPITASAQEAAPAPPPVNVLDRGGKLAPGDIFITPTATTGSGYANGPEILDNEGQPIWFLPLAQGQAASDFRVQSYQGRQVLTWWEGTPLSLAGPGPGTDYIANRHYQVIATVSAGNGQSANGHEFQITPWGTALLTIYKRQSANLTSVGGAANAQVLAGVVQEIDIKTGKVLFEWNSTEHVPFGDSHEPLPANPSEPWDYFHINAVKVDPDGSILISARHTWTIYKVDLHTSQTIWELGGRQSSFKLGPGVQFAWQHDPEVLSENGQGETLRIFDNESNGTPVLPATRIITVHIDYHSDTATLLSAFEHPEGLSAASQGDAQTLPDGDIFVGWGQLGRYSELDQSGDLLYDVTLASGYDTYRAYRFPWRGQPASGPSAIAQAQASGGASVQAIWNGATGVAHWQVLGGASQSSLHPIGSAHWNGLDTTIPVSAQTAYVQVVAYDHGWNRLGVSSVASETPAA